MTKEEIQTYLLELNDGLKEKNLKGEICLYGGAAMCLVYDARPATKDIDAVFQPTAELREIASQIAKKHDLPSDWLNDAVKGFLVPHSQEVFLELDHLCVFVPSPDYLLATKVLAARLDTSDKNDAKKLISALNLKSPKEAFELVEKYYPRNQIKPATQFFIEEIFDDALRNQTKDVGG